MPETLRITAKRIVRRLLSKRPKPHRVLAGPLRGARIVTSWHDYPASITGRTEIALLCWLSQNVRAGETWLDVGAHYGYTAIALSRLVGSSGRVFAFEPVITTAGCLAQTAKLNGFVQTSVIPFGLGDPESLEYQRVALERGMADRTLSSGRCRSFDAIHIARLDWLWPFVNGSNDAIDGVKIDVQGMELDALRGMQELLRRQRPKMIVEFHSGVDRSRVLTLLACAGYDAKAQPVEAQGDAELRDNCSYVFVSK